jgi:hypothetical protein
MTKRQNVEFEITPANYTPDVVCALFRWQKCCCRFSIGVGVECFLTPKALILSIGM